jgi:hypothetical protein
VTERRDLLYWFVLATAAGTFASGVVLMAAQRFVLDILSAPTATSDRVFFGIIGMFMAIVGGEFTQAVWRRPSSAFVIGWSALQKLGASGAMSLAVALGVLSYYGTILAGFDFCSGVAAIVYWRRIRT